jgi:hypothetical protein
MLKCGENISSGGDINIHFRQKFIASPSHWEVFSIGEL